MTTLIAWFTAHPAAVAAAGGAVVSLIDFIFAIKPDWKSNGIFHWVYLQALALAGKTPAA